MLAAIAAPILLGLLMSAGLRAAPGSGAARLIRSPWTWALLVVLAGLIIPNTYPYGDAVRFYQYVPRATGPEANAPLSFETHRLAAALLPGRLVVAFSLLSTAGGILMVPGLFRLARAIFPAEEDGARRGFFLIGMAGSAAWQLFVGYVEHYHVQLALVVWGAAFLIEQGRRGRGASSRGGLIGGAMLIGLAAAWDLSAAWLLPAVVAAGAFGAAGAPGGTAGAPGGAAGASSSRAGVRSSRGGARGGAIALAAALLPVGATLALVAVLHGPPAVVSAYQGGFHPLTSANAGFVTAAEWLSPSHLLFLANDLVLVAPLAFVLAAPLVVGGRGPVPRERRSLEAALLAGSLAFAFFWNPRLGWLADWDLFAWPLFLVQALALAAALRREPVAPRARAWLPLFATAQSLALLFLLSNSRLGVAR